MSSGNLAIIEAYRKGYRVDKFGNVYSKNGNRRALKSGKGGYLAFNIRRDNGKTWPLLVHRLQAYQKYGENLFSADCVRHLDGNKENNSYDNISIGSTMDNWMDIPERRRVEICATANQKYNTEIVREIREKHKNGTPMKVLMCEYNITSKGTFSYILNKRLIDY